MQYIEAPSDEVARYPSVFLAGGITNCPDWQRDVVTLLNGCDITVYNPRRANFPMGDPDAGRVQVEWEYKRLHSADIVSFWFSVGSLNPIVLFEYGAALARNWQRLVVGVHPKYERRFDVETQTALARPRQRIVYSVPFLVACIRAALESVV